MGHLLVHYTHLISELERDKLVFFEWHNTLLIQSGQILYKKHSWIQWNLYKNWSLYHSSIYHLQHFLSSLCLSFHLFRYICVCIYFDFLEDGAWLVIGFISSPTKILKKDRSKLFRKRTLSFEGPTNASKQSRKWSLKHLKLVRLKGYLIVFNKNKILYALSH